MTNDLTVQIPSVEAREFAYDLPADKIAEHPLPRREAARMMVVDVASASIQHSHAFSLPSFLPSPSVLVLNTTKVIAARLAVEKSTGGAAEVLLLKPVAPSTDPAVVLSGSEPSEWECMIGGRRIKPGDLLTPVEGRALLSVEVISRNGTDGRVLLVPRGGKTLAEAIDLLGKIPLPPYINRDVQHDDAERYQTVFAMVPGSVAAPTASLHYTEEVLNHCTAAGVQIVKTVLHVGAGTFKPMTAENCAEHEMHGERFEMSLETIRALLAAKRNGHPVTAIGTTAARTLESVAALGSQVACGDFDGSLGDVLVDQWAAWVEPWRGVGTEQALAALASRLEAEGKETVVGLTRLMIVPGHRWRLVNVLGTNFHQPSSTLLMLVASILGERWKEVYETALCTDYRFLSYGDTSLLYLPPEVLHD